MNANQSYTLGMEVATSAKRDGSGSDSDDLKDDIEDVNASYSDYSSVARVNHSTLNSSRSGGTNSSSGSGSTSKSPSSGGSGRKSKRNQRGKAAA